MNASTVVDFTSSLVLGYEHGSQSLAAWSRLTTGVPAALREDRLAETVAQTVASAQQAEAGLVSRSTLHALSDALGELPRKGDLVAVDEFSYPIARWAVLRAADRGAIVRCYPHHCPDRLIPSPGRRLFLVTDGWCPGCNRPAPLARLQRLVQDCDGLVVVDDTLAAGVLGRRAAPGSAALGSVASGSAPGSAALGSAAGWFGAGEGTVRWAGIESPGILWIASLAKAFGSPLALTTGDRATIRRLADGGTRWHSSPPSAADLAAAAAVLADPVGADGRRQRLETKVFRIRRGLRAAGLPPVGLPFPLVCFVPPAGPDAGRWQRALRSRGLLTVVQRPRCRPGSVIGLLVRADHRDDEIDRLVDESARLAVAGRAVA